MPSSLERVLGFAHGAARHGGPAPSDTEIARAFDGYRAAGHRRLAEVRISSAGVAFGSLYDAIRDGSIGLETAELTLVDPPAAGPAWEFLRPFRRIELFPDGSAELSRSAGPAQHAIARVVLRESDAPVDAHWAEGLGHATFAAAVDYLRSGVVVPFVVALLLYFPEERVRFEFDLTDDALLRDPRAGRIPPNRRVRRPSRLAWAVDRFAASESVSLGEGRLLDVLSDLRSASFEELAALLGGSRAAAQQALARLIRLGRVQAETSARHYRLRPEPFRDAGTTATPAAAPAPRAAVAVETGGPGLQQDLADLVASAEARATCPLCGTELPAGFPGIVCAKCAAEVSDYPTGG